MAVYMNWQLPRWPSGVSKRLFVTVLIAMGMLFSIFYSWSHLYGLDNGTSYKEVTRVPLGLTPTPPAFDDLDQKLALSMLPARLPCDAIREERYKHLRGHPLMFALILHQSEKVLRSLVHAILEVTQFVGPNTTHISIYESQSSDRTGDLLTTFKKHLEEKVSPAGLTIVTDGDHESWDVWNRIALLAKYRNNALEPLFKKQQKPHPKTVLFINDIYVCPSQILELLHQHVYHEADASCGLDWSDNENFYDAWVAKNIHGDAIIEIPETEFHQRANVFENTKEDRNRYEAGMNVQIYACWNGMIAMRPEPFTSDKSKVRFRRGRLDGECPVSEAQLLAKDFWTHGYRKWQIVPSVNVGYRLEDTVREMGRKESGKLWDGTMEWLDVMPEKVRCNPQPELGESGTIWDKTLWVEPVDKL